MVSKRFKNQISSVISAAQEEDVRRIMVQDQHGQEISETTISINKSGMVARTHQSSYSGGHV
jgi:hypothetical protein